MSVSYTKAREGAEIWLHLFSRSALDGNDCKLHAPKVEPPLPTKSGAVWAPETPGGSGE